ncbi:MAG: DUF11 domain-containing protein [Methanosphaera sp.]|nr:DUF11 domain-containing protein [Methanosphaera sp.]
MVKFKKVLFILIILLISITTVSATDQDIDDNTTTTQDIENTTKTIKQTTEPNDNSTTEYVNTYSQLENAITNAKSNTNSTTYIINLETGTYTIDKSIKWQNIEGTVEKLVINGNDSIISGENNYSFIQIAANTTVEINNLTVCNTTRNIGSALYNSGNVTLNNVNMIDNHATLNSSYGGGAIYNTGLLVINNSTFINNTSQANGGVIYNTITYLNTVAQVIINNSKFICNEASKAGGAIYNHLNSHDNTNSQVIIDNCQFISNKAEEASAIYNYNSIKFLINNTIIANHSGNSLIKYIIATNTSSMEIINSQISENNHITLIENEGSLIIDNSTINDNNCSEMINTTNYLDLTNSLIENNTITTLITNTDILKITNTTINYNNISNNAIINKEANVSVENSIFMYNNISDALIYDDMAHTSIVSSVFISNKSPNLFKAEYGVFNLVYNNTYRDNMLGDTNISTEYKDLYNYDENITLTGTVIINPIYNTTINTGYVLLKSNDQIIANSTVTNNTFYFNESININTTNLEVYYEGENDFINCGELIEIKIVTPEYQVNINTNNSQASYGDIIEYEISITNTAQANGSKIVINNIFPNTLELIDQSRDSYDNLTNTWYIDKLESNTTKKITIKAVYLSLEDITIKVNLTDSKLNSTIIADKLIEYIEPQYDITLAMSDNYTLGDTMNDSIILSTIKGCGHNMTLTINITNNNTTYSYEEYFISSLDDNPQKFVISKYINEVGNYTVYIHFEDMTNNTLIKSYSFSVSTPFIILDNITSSRSDIVNITAKVVNINSSIMPKVVFKLNYNTIKGYDIIIEDNYITLVNYNISDELQNSQYILEVKYDYNLTGLLVNTSYLTLNKLDTTITLEGLIHNNKINVTARVLDSNGNNVTQGKVIFKINGKTLKDENNNTLYVSVVNGIATLGDYQYEGDLYNDNYTITAVYIGNSIYTEYRISSVINNKIDKENIDISISYLKNPQNEQFILNITITSKNTSEAITEGNIVVKLNGKTVSSKINVRGSTITYTSDVPLEHINNITISYSGTRKYYEDKKTFELEQDSEIKTTKQLNPIQY